MDLDTSFGRWLRARRRALDLTQDDLARRVGCAVVTIQKIEADERRPSRQLATRLADGLQIAADDRAAIIMLARAEPYLDPAAATAAERPLRAPQRPPPNLRTPLTGLIGRKSDIAAVRNVLLRGETRLLTLIGPPGIGKTRLSLAVAHDVQAAFRDGASFVALAPISDPALVLATIAQALGIKETAGQPLLDQLVAVLQTQRRLLLLDNFEQVLAAAALVAAVLEACPGVKALITSRAALHVRGERLYPVPALLLPNLTRLPAPSALAHTPAVALLVERAQAVLPAFQLTAQNAAAVAAICVRLDGLPLAIELAATRMTLLPPAVLLARLEQRLALLTDGARDLPPRHQTLRAAIAWSYELLDAHAQTLFRRLGVFVGGWTLVAAEAVCSDNEAPRQSDQEIAPDRSPCLAGSLSVLDGLATLVDTSLLRRADGEEREPRFTMLETIREYALERLEQSGEAAVLRRRHADYYIALMEQINAEGGEWEHWDARTRSEYANLRAVLGWCRTAGFDGTPEADLGLRLARTLRQYWGNYDQHEGLLWLRELCSPAWSHGPAHLRARLLSSLGQYLAFSNRADDRPQARAVLAEGLRLSRHIGDMGAIAEVCRHLGEVAFGSEDLAGAEGWFAESLVAARAADSPWNTAWTQFGFGRVAVMRGEDREAARVYEECLARFQGLGYTAGVAVVVGHYSATLLRLGHLERAAALLDALLVTAHVDWPVAELRNLHDYRGQVAYAQSDMGRASEHFTRALRCERAMVSYGDNLPMFQHLLSEIAVVAAAQGQHVHATRLISHAPVRFYYNKPNQVQAQLSQALAICRAALGDTTFATAWTAGQALTLEQAIAEALQS